MLSDLNLTDMETCYKAFRREVIQSIDFQEDRFGFEPEVTAKVARAGWRVYEVGISYNGRTYAEGKKIGWRDGMRALYSIVRYSPLLEPVNGFPVVREEPPPDFEDSDSELETVLDSLRGARNYADWLYELCAPYLGSEVLEVGAGHGEFTQRLADDDKFVTAIDLSKRCVDQLERDFGHRPNVEVRHTAIDGVIGDRKYDSALLVNVLEHIPDDLAALQDLRALLKPGGRIIVFAPAFDGLYSDFDRLVGHHRRYRKSHLVTLADRAGLKVVDVRYVNSVGAIAWWLFARRLHQLPTQGWSVKLYDNAVVPLLRKRETSSRRASASRSCSSPNADRRRLHGRQRDAGVIDSPGAAGPAPDPVERERGQHEQHGLGRRSEASCAVRHRGDDRDEHDLHEQWPDGRLAFAVEQPGSGRANGTVAQ